MQSLRRFSLLSALAFLGTVAVPQAASAASLTVSTTGSDSAACTSTAPCKSIARAYQAAAPGDVVSVAAGSYGSQSIPYDSTKTSETDVIIRPAAGAKVTFSGLGIAGRHVTVQDVVTGFVDIKKGPTGNAPSDATVINGSGTGVFIGGGVSDVLIKGGSYGNYYNAAPVKVQGSPAPTRITFDGVDFHDAIRTDPAAHMECIYAADVQQFTVRNSSFRNCAIFDLVFTNLSGKDPADIVIENNTFDYAVSHSGVLSTGYYALSFYPSIKTLSNVTVRNNSFYQGFNLQAGTWNNVKFTNNIIPNGTSCYANVTYSYNVMTGRACSATDRLVPGAMSHYADPANYDFSLKSGASAIDAGNPMDYTPTDIRGGARPVGVAPDAGAFEYGSSGGGGGTPSPGDETPAPDTTAPSTTISSAPSGTTTSTSANFEFSGTDDVTPSSGLTFECSLDGAGYQPCTSPKSYSGLAVGTHTFATRARDAAGNVDASPATASWTITSTTTPPSNGLVAAYGLNETGGAVIRDASGSGLNGTASNTWPTGAGKFGGALRFNGSSSWITVADNDKLDLSTRMTLEAWVKPANAMSSWRSILVKERTGGLSYGLYANTNTNQPAGLAHTSAEFDTRGGSRLPVNTWSHLAVTYDGSYLRLFVNGVQISARALTGSMVAGTGALRIGGNSIWSEWFNGLVDEVRVYNRALTATEIKSDMAKAI
jgi:hypothetical protein